MTLDEAIAHEKELAKEIYIDAMLCHANPDDGKLDDCIERGKYHEQLAEWLEELKKIKSNGRYVQGNKAGQKIGYRNAIDDLSNKICMHFSDWEYSEDDKCIKDIIELASESVEEIAERLKAGGENE